MLTAYFEVEKTMAEARGLLTRFQRAEGFRGYLYERRALVLPAAGVLLVVSVAFAVGSVIFLAERHPLLALPGLVLAPLVLAGSLFVQAYVFFSWLEHRAITRVLRRPPPATTRVPWALAALFFALPLALLALVWTAAALAAVLALIAVPLLYTRLDRG